MTAERSKKRHVFSYGLIPANRVNGLALKLRRLLVDLGEDNICTSPAVKEIGKELNRIGGMDAMHAGLRLIPPSQQRVFDIAFDGIGDWRC